MCTKINKIAFVITDKVTWNHLKNIIHVLPEDSYDIIIADEKQASKGLYMFFRAFARKMVGFTNGVSIKSSVFEPKVLKNAKNINDVITDNLKYKCAICVFPDMTGSIGDKWKLELIADKLIRAAFISGAYAYMLNLEANKKFDYILCCGSEQKKAYERLGIKACVIDVGNPRLLSPTTCRAEEDPIYKRLDKNRKTILWIPSHGRKSCSLPNYLPVFSKLQKDFNVIVSYPLGIYQDFCFLRHKIEKVIKVLVNNRDSASLMYLADFVFCDYGGSMLTSIYYEKNVCLLNAKKENVFIVEKNFGENSPEITLRKDIVNFDSTNTYEDFLYTLNNNNVWEQQKKIIKEIKEKFFSESAENAIKKIQNFLLSMLSM